MKLFDTLKGKKVIVTTDYGDIQLTIKEVKEETEYVETGPSNQANDWYPEGYHKTTYRVTFDNGKVKVYDNLSSINLVEA